MALLRESDPVELQVQEAVILQAGEYMDHRDRRLASYIAQCFAG